MRSSLQICPWNEATPSNLTGPKGVAGRIRGMHYDPQPRPFQQYLHHDLAQSYFTNSCDTHIQECTVHIIRTYARMYD